MKRSTASWIFVLATVLGCPASPTAEPTHTQQHGEHDEHDDAEAHHGDDGDHHDEPSHGEIPQRVLLSPEVRADIGIETAPVARRAIERTLRLPGEITADPDRQAHLSARLTGVIESTEVRAGDRVEKNDVIAVIRTADIQGLRASETALKAQAASAKSNAERLKALVEKGMATAQEVTTAEAEATALSAEANGVRQRLRALGARGSGDTILYKVRAPWAGVVTERPISLGDPVTPQTVVATVVDLQEVWFVAHVFERDVARVEEQASAAVVLNAYPNDAFAGVVTQLSYDVDPGARTLSARIPLTNGHQKLRLGLFGIAFVALDEAPHAPRLAVPRSAVVDVLGSPTVFVDHPDGHLERHDVVLGEADTTYVEIMHGLREGEQIVTRGTFSVKATVLRSTFGEDHH